MTYSAFFPILQANQQGGMLMELDFETFFTMNKNRIYYQIHRLNIPKELHEKFYTEGIVALWQAYKEYDATKGNVGTFINYRIRYRLIDLLRKKARQQERQEQIIDEQKRQLTDGNHSRQSSLPLIDPTVDYIDIPCEHNREFWTFVKSQLTKKQWKWVKYFIIADLSIKEIMEIENVTADAVKGWGQAVRKKLRRKEIKETLYKLLYG